ncbi:MAG: trypsin-like peptidase domain-containing protein [Polyangiaceae bacterium]|nr:trypsin-like peptidase domain-containing protein [Polyangiaceae bacterium]
MMHRFTRELPQIAGITGLSTLLAALVACGSSPATVAANTPEKAPSKAETKAPAEETAASKPAPVVCVSKEKMMGLLAKGPLPPVPQNVKSAVASLGAGGAKADNSMAEAYKKVAPATVIVKTENGMGSGVIVDPAGWVLTNYHVVDGGKTEDFKIKATVEVGKMTPQGRMERVEHVYDAFVHKADPVRDMAVLKIVNPPKDLPAVKIAKSDIPIGSPVMTVAHASIGFLWAVKGCQVAAVGEKAKDLAGLVVFDCKKNEGNTPEEEVSAKQCDERKQMIHDMINSQQQGLVIQTDCAVTHGDSGGPLVNTAGELVGINQSIKFDKATTSFHVHGSEIREFLSKIPAKPAQLPPDPWCDGGFDSSIEDVDLDGQIDTLFVKGYGETGLLSRMALLLDLDQDHFSSKSAAKQGSDTPFDAEAIILMKEDGAYVWYDSDNDGKLDLMLLDKERQGSPDSAWKIAADGSMEKDADKAGGFDLRPELFADSQVSQRFARIASVIRPLGWMSFGSLLKAAEPTVPDAIWGGGRKGQLRDVDADGRPDTVRVSSTFSDGFLIDADQDTLGSLASGDNVQALINNRGIDAELSIVSQGQNLWALYDTNNDSKFDLALFSPPTDNWGLAMGAWRLTDGKPSPDAQHIGRRLIRPGLVEGAAGTKLVNLAARLPYPAATDEGLGSVPNPYALGRGFEIREVKGFQNAVIQSGQALSSIVMIDIDRSSSKGMKAGGDIDRMVRSGGFKADVAHVHHKGFEWVYYDTDQDGAFDLVLLTGSPRNGQSERALRLSASGKLEIDAKAGAGPLIRHSVFAKKDLGTQFKKLAKELFAERAIEP